MGRQLSTDFLRVAPGDAGVRLSAPSSDAAGPGSYPAPPVSTHAPSSAARPGKTGTCDAKALESTRQITGRSLVRIEGGVPVPTGRWSAAWAEELRCNTDVYNRRWYIETPWFSLRLHHWLRSDDSRAFHDHPWNFWVFVLSGGYLDRTPYGDEIMHAGKCVYRDCGHMHWVDLYAGPCWSLVLTGPKVRRWGFWKNGKFTRSNKYFLRWGSHPCE